MTTAEVVVVVSIFVMLLGGVFGIVVLTQELYALIQDIRDSLFGDALEAQYAATQEMLR